MDAYIPYEKIIFVCVNRREKECCAGRNSEAIGDLLKAAVRERGLQGKVRVSKSLCMDRCKDGPTVMVFPDNAVYGHVTVADVPKIIKKHIP